MKNYFKLFAIAFILSNFNVNAQTGWEGFLGTAYFTQTNSADTNEVLSNFRFKPIHDVNYYSNSTITLSESTRIYTNIHVVNDSLQYASTMREIQYNTKTATDLITAYCLLNIKDTIKPSWMISSYYVSIWGGTINMTKKEIGGVEKKVANIINPEKIYIFMPNGYKPNSVDKEICKCGGY